MKKAVQKLQRDVPKNFINPLTQKVGYLDKLVDELAKGKSTSSNTVLFPSHKKLSELGASFATLC